MCLTTKCAQCGKFFTFRSSPGIKGETMGERMVRLATQPVNEYDFWCVDCILDSPKAYLSIVSQ